MKAAIPLFLVLAGCSVEAPAPKPVPKHSVEIVSLTCAENYGKTRADLTVRNTGGQPIPYAKATVKFAQSAGDSFIDPTQLPAGAVGSATIYAQWQEPSPTCELISLQDGDGNPVSF